MKLPVWPAWGRLTICKSYIHLEDKVLNLYARGNHQTHSFLSSKTTVDRRGTLFLFANDQFLMRAERSFFGWVPKWIFSELSSAACWDCLCMCCTKVKYITFYSSWLDFLTLKVWATALPFTTCSNDYNFWGWVFLLRSVKKHGRLLLCISFLGFYEIKT